MQNNIEEKMQPLKILQAKGIQLSYCFILFSYFLCVYALCFQ